jgi:hypothetical protein
MRLDKEAKQNKAHLIFRERNIQKKRTKVPAATVAKNRL